MRPLQDKCEPSSIEAIQELFVEDMGTTINALFSEFDPNPIGVASLAQVHEARLKDGTRVAVKIQHPHLREFTNLECALVLKPFYNTRSNIVLGQSSNNRVAP